MTVNDNQVGGFFIGELLFSFRERLWAESRVMPDPLALSCVW